MSDTKLFAVFLIVLASFGVYLHSQDKLIPMLDVLVKPINSTSKSKINLGTFLVALVTYLFILSFLNTKDGLMLTGLVVTGALIYNHKTMGNESLLAIVLKKTEGG